ncbi:BZ3500_MvSof-1268-A1-R1_Chr1-3g01726 [Microbotryum saponariae]|uniref:BZ3500_MvSof-1268-A1-R1_Chr1-3g01726 protein n=1 Tax=Microbotryum saponariae TaxID=289078 RepID=A0A2X0KB47_9BASI|nr:BZ3500_MvSof-1268-A1-R1_Chr1-3g01726 [Microbotryum saponariae]SCZ94443.1 BZ3501_MvSof-1269-A2-R1_Chr1-3g01327 [Microbotryum saponariae]
MDSNMSSSSTPVSSSSLSALAAGGPANGSGSSGSSGDRQDYFGTLAIVDSAGASAKAPAPATLTGDNSNNYYNHQPLHHPTAYPYHASWVAGSVAPAPGSATAAASPSAGAPAASALSAAVGDPSNVLEPTRSRPSLHDRGAPLGSPSTLSNVGAAWINRYHQAMPRHTMSNGTTTTTTTTGPASATSRGGTHPVHAIVPNQGHHAHGHAQAHLHHPAYPAYPASSSSHHTQHFNSGGAALSHLLHHSDQTETSSAAPHCNPHGGPAPYPTPVTPSLLSSSNMPSNQTSMTHVESSALEVAPNSVSSSAAAAAVAAAGATAPGSLHTPMATSTTTTTAGHPIAIFSQMHSHLWPSYPSSTVASSPTTLGPAASRPLAPPAAATAPAPINSVHELLYSLHLTQYYDTFVAEGFDRLEALDDITEADFEAVGVRRGHRRLIQRHLASIKALYRLHNGAVGLGQLFGTLALISFLSGYLLRASPSVSVAGLPTSAPLVLPIALGHGENGTISTVPALAVVKNNGLGKAEWVDPTVADQAPVVAANAADEFAPKSKMEDEAEESDDNQIGDVSLATTLVEDQEMSNLSSSTGVSRARGGSKSRGVKRKSIAPATTAPTSVTQTNRNVFYIHPTNSASVTRSTTASPTAVPIHSTAVSTSAAPGTRMNPAKRRYRRHPKPDPNAPVKPSSAYVEFSTSIRAQLGTSKSFTEIARIVGEKWQALPCLEKADLERRTIEAKEAYARDLELYQQGKEWREYEAYLKEFRAKYPDSAIGPSTTAAGVAELETGSSPAPSGSGSGSGSTAGKESKVVGSGKGRGGRRSSTRTVQLAAPMDEGTSTSSVRMGRRTSTRRSLAKNGAREEVGSDLDFDFDGDGDGEGEGEDVDGEGETDEDALVGSSTTTMTNGSGVDEEGKREEFDKEQWDAVRVLANVHRRESELSR